MCKNAENPSPGCKKHKPAESAWMFFSDVERQALEVLSNTEAPGRAAAHP